MNVHTFSLRVYFEDTDTLGIVYHPQYLKFMERARTELLRSIGFDHSFSIKNSGLGFVVSKCSINFRATAFLDDLLEVHTEIISLKGARLRLKQVLFRKKELIAEADIDLALINLKTRRPERISSVVLDGLTRHNYY